MRSATDLFLRMERAGFTLVRSHRHAIWQCPCGHMRIVTSCTPGKGRAEGNSESLMNRTLRVCAQNKKAAA